MKRAAEMVNIYTVSLIVHLFVNGTKIRPLYKISVILKMKQFEDFVFENDCFLPLF